MDGVTEDKMRRIFRECGIELKSFKKGLLKVSIYEMGCSVDRELDLLMCAHIQG